MKASRNLIGSIAAPILEELNKNELWKIAGRRIHKLEEHGMFEIPIDNLIVQITAEHKENLLRLVVLTKDETMRLDGNKLSLVLPDKFKNIDHEGKLIKHLFSTGNAVVNDFSIISCEIPQAGKGIISVMTLDVALATVDFPVTGDATYEFHDDIEPLLNRKLWGKPANDKK